MSITELSAFLGLLIAFGMFVLKVIEVVRRN